MGGEGNLGERSAVFIFGSHNTVSIWLEANGTELISWQGGVWEGAGAGAVPPPQAEPGDFLLIELFAFSERLGHGVTCAGVFPMALGSLGWMGQGYRSVILMEKSCPECSLLEEERCRCWLSH